MEELLLERELVCVGGPEEGRVLSVLPECGEVVIEEPTTTAAQRLGHRYVRDFRRERLVYRGSRLRRVQISPCTCPECVG